MSKVTAFKPVRHSLESLLGEGYIEAVVSAQAALTGRGAASLRRLAQSEVDFFPRSLQERLARLLPKVGSPVAAALARPRRGAPTYAFDAADKPTTAPLAGLGYYRVGQDGRLYFISKSEHYHAPLGHNFPGYTLIEYARKLGLSNPTHNNTRGYITRLLEEQLIRTANGLAQSDKAGLQRVLRSRARSTLNRTINLQTGSLAVEAGIKMMLARFHKIQAESDKPKYQNLTPVILVLGDDEGGLQGNYHGTTALTQMMRGMWPGIAEGLETSGVMKVAAIRPNRIADAEAAFKRYEKRPFKIAGFCHELVMMNYGGRLLDRDFIRGVYKLCRAHDVPVLADEIQSCLWSPQLYMFREYALRPTLVAIGKGFPGGQSAASRLLFSASMDCLPLFGALVTNGQEELASLSYLITIRWAQDNSAVIRKMGDYYQQALRRLARKHSAVVTGIDGSGHLAAVRFDDLETANAMVKSVNQAGFDISVQTYKADCPPCALTKLPIIVGYRAVDAFIAQMDMALRTISHGSGA
ncbi:MAG: aminotransferase class III-fold pyridoxal phosphate-dependent enzyme [Planctomycetes bacterium]|nr:aminotransferase class III-fold pyridoxal phosphate-dependent enzyme [Planctomycetota bacterium]